MSDQSLPPERSRKIHVFFHICCINNYIEVANEIIDKIIGSGLYGEATKIFYSILGNADASLIERFKKLDKLELVYSSADIKEVEYPTLIKIYEFCLKNDSMVLYLHTKGVSNPRDRFRQLWRKRLLQKTVGEYNVCIKQLNSGYDISGCGWKEMPKAGQRVNYAIGTYPHYSGNFWWANSNYIRTLPNIKKIEEHHRAVRHNKFDKYRLNCESWIGMIPTVKVGVNGEINKEYSNTNYHIE